MCFSSICGGGKPKGDGGAAAAAHAEAARQAAISAGTKQIDSTLAAFDPAYYAERGQSYSDYATPQLNDQYTAAKKNLIYSLSGKNLLNSTVAAQEQKDLEKQYGTFRTDIANQADSYANSARSNVEQARQNLYAQNANSAGVGTGQAAALELQNLQATPPAFNPVGQFAFNLGNNLATYNTAVNGSRPLASSPLFSSGSNSTSVK